MSPWRTALWRTIIYVVLGTLYILYSDRLLATLVDDTELLTRLQTVKGFGFVLVTGAMFFFLMLGALAREQSLAKRDKLTQLLNRHMFKQELASELEFSNRHQRKVALVIFNIDGFRQINHTAGQVIGDQVLLDVATLMRQHFAHQQSVVGRFGGDEFAVAIANLEHCEPIVELARKVQQSISQIRISEHPKLSISAGVGIACSPSDADNLRDLVTAANLALEEAKGIGAGQLRLYDHFLGESVHSRLQLTADLRQALINEELSLVYQPQFSACNLSITGVEVLVRWRHPSLGVVPPDTFIPLAEQQGLISLITDFVCQKAIQELSEQNLLGKDIPRVSINVSAHDFNDDDSAAEFMQRFAHLDDWSCIQLELTETAIISNFDNTLSVLNELQDQRINISIDDFGTGYSSLNVLRKLPIDEVKIDKTFIRDMQTDENARTIVRTILVMAHSLHLRVVAEGVECTEQAQYLREYGCDELQGYLLAEPMPIGALGDFCAAESGTKKECGSTKLTKLRNYIATQEGFTIK